MCGCSNPSCPCVVLLSSGVLPVIVQASPTLTCSGAACFLRSDGTECPNYCSDQGRCEGGRCVCFAGFNGHDCGTAVCPSDCRNNGKCVNGQCVCDNGYSGLDCTNQSCPGNCNNHGQCVKGKCACHHGFMGTDCGTGKLFTAIVHIQTVQNKPLSCLSINHLWKSQY